MSKSLGMLLKCLWLHIQPNRQREFYGLLGLTFISALAEIVSLSSVLPFVGILTQPEKVFKSPYLSGFINQFGISSSAELILPLAIGFAVMALVAGSLRLFLLWASIKLGNAIGTDLSVEVYSRTLYQPYSVHISRSSSVIISGITQKVASATNILISSVAFVTSVFLFLAIITTLLIVDPYVALISAFCFGMLYYLIALFTRKRLIQNSGIVASQQVNVVRTLQEGLGAIRDILLDGAQIPYAKHYHQSIIGLQRAAGENTFINQSPRYVMEALGMLLISLLVLVLMGRDGGVAAALPVLATLALGAQRTLPLMQQIYGNWSILVGNKAALVNVLELLEQPLPKNAAELRPKKIDFTRDILFDKVSFRYSDNYPLVLDGLTFKVNKGDCIGIIGSTGSGKSTMLDLLMKLIHPTGGQILVDGREITLEKCQAWQGLISHVPQSIFLTDATILENVAFGIPYDQIDFDRVKVASQRAQISEFIESHPDGYEAFVGERGVRLSGGQRQRIGIARALYKDSKVLILDEATSALDHRTESNVMDAIQGLEKNITLFIIAHRLTTLKRCTKILKLDKGRVKVLENFDEIEILTQAMEKG